jgi:selenocysteine lyase/cysteine desulfurase
MHHQRHLFQLPDDVHYLNGAYMSPLMKSVEEAGIEGMQRKRNPSGIAPADFFEDSVTVRSCFAQIVKCRPEQIAIIPSVSYGLASAMRNLPVDIGQTAIVVGDEFPSDYYAVEAWCKDNDKRIQIVKAPEVTQQRGERWNQAILESINVDTAVLVLSSIHWTDGTIFDLRAIGQRCREVNARFIVDGTQSVGVMPIDVGAYNIDVLICAGYKWLLGPYSIGVAYYGGFFNEGSPIEEAWVNRSNARDFSALTLYTNEYTPGAGRYNAGEYGNFILVPMLAASLKQILEWDIVNINAYCRSLTQPLAAWLVGNGYTVEDDQARSPHIIGVGMPAALDMDKVVRQLQERKIYVSRRGKAIRVSAHVYNSQKDTDALVDALSALRKSL